MFSSLFILGNLLGPVVNTTIQGGLEKKFQLPTGCGEQMMIQMAPNVYILEYLMKTNQLTGADEEKAYHFIQHGRRGYLWLSFLYVIRLLQLLKTFGKCKYIYIYIFFFFFNTRREISCLQAAM